jgi:hypothetical protein
MLARWLAMFAVAAALVAQTAPQPAGMSGTVTNSLTGEPIVRAHVMVRCICVDRQEGEKFYGALTNEKGGFSITPLLPGDCSINVERVGFVTPHNGASYPLSSGTHKDDLKLTLTPTAAITGHVVNATGGPAQGVSVSAETPNGNSWSSTTDDKGQFRIGGLRPGKYRVKATPQSMPLPPEIRSDGRIEQKEAATYYPGSLDTKTAQRLEIKADTEISGVDIKLIQTPIVQVSGKVTDIPAGVKDVMVSVRPSGQGASVKANGTFSLWRLDPGKYTLQAQHWGQSTMLSTPIEIEVTAANLEHLELRMIPPFEIAGQLRFDDDQSRETPNAPGRSNTAAPSAPSVLPHAIQLLPINGQNVVGLHAIAGSDDTFTLEQVQPARYHVTVDGVSGYVKSIRMGEKETDGEILDVRNGGAGPLTVTLSSNYCEVSGTVSDSTGPVADAPVILAPADDPSHVQVAHSDSTGAYKLRVPPGKYKLAALDENAMAWGFQGPELEDYDPETVELSGGDKVAKDLLQHK